ncbi:MAG: helix-turn-helix domain-containing protein [Verrucomicrobia bacterium]|nr:helix-turn-helix domain-containing protein [Verrucomicrobiota bacterium]
MSDGTNDSSCSAPTEAIFKALVRAPAVRELIAGIQQATSLALKLVPADACRRCPSLESPENPFCAFAKRQEHGPNACCKACDDLLGRVQRNVRPYRLTCFSGMIHTALPIVVSGQHVATLTAGQVFLRQPGRHAFGRVRKALTRLGHQRQLARLERLWWRTPCLSRRRFAGCITLLSGFARLLAHCAGRWVIADSNTEPLAVERTKQYVRAHLAEPISLGTVAKHVHLNRHYFCKLFRRTTGMTFTHYIRMVRIEKAKDLLRDSRLSIKEVAYKSGFRSISHFNHIFRSATGITPSLERANHRQAKANPQQTKRIGDGAFSASLNSSV